MNRSAALVSFVIWSVKCGRVPAVTVCLIGSNRSESVLEVVANIAMSVTTTCRFRVDTLVRLTDRARTGAAPTCESYLTRVSPEVVGRFSAGPTHGAASGAAGDCVKTHARGLPIHQTGSPCTKMRLTLHCSPHQAHNGTASDHSRNRKMSFDSVWRQVRRRSPPKSTELS